VTSGFDETERGTPEPVEPELDPAFDALQEAAAELADILAPVGTDFGAVTVAFVAVALVAGIALALINVLGGAVVLRGAIVLSAVVGSAHFAYFVVASWRLALWRAENAEEAMEAADGIVDDLWQRIEARDEELRESAAALKRAAKVAGARRRRGEFLWLVAGAAVLARDGAVVARDGAVKKHNQILAAYRPLLKEHLELKKAHSLLQLGSVLQAVDASSESGRGGAVYTQSAAMRLAEGALVRRGMQAPAIIDGDNPLGGDKPTSQWATGEGTERTEQDRRAWFARQQREARRGHPAEAKTKLGAEPAAATTAAHAEVKAVAKRAVAKRAVAKRAEPKPELPAWRDGWGGHDPDATDGGTAAALVVAGVPNTGEFDTRIVQVDDLKVVLSPLGPLAAHAVEPKKGQQPVSPELRADLVALGHILAPQLAPLPGDQT
jgi:hypothetical protein